MSVPAADRLPVGLLDGARASSSALARLAAGASRVLAFLEASDADAFERRWSAVGGGVALEVLPPVDDVRDAILECAGRGVLVLATPTPAAPARFVARALQGAAAATELYVPAVAVHVLRDTETAGPVAWMTQTGTLSGYGVLFAIGYAQLHDLPVTLVEPPQGTLAPRTQEALDAARVAAARCGVQLEELTDPSPIDRVIRDAFSLAVHPVLDAPGGHQLLRPTELPASSVAEGNPAAVVRLLEEFDGDVVAVFDGVRLLHGETPAARVAASVALSLAVFTGVGVAAAPLAMAAPLSASSVSATSDQRVSVQVTGASTLTVSNPTSEDLDVTVWLQGQHGHAGTTYDAGSRVLASVPAGAHNLVVHLPEFTHDWGHNLHAVRLTVHDASGNVNLVVPITGGGPRPGTTVTVTPPHPTSTVVSGTEGPTLVEKQTPTAVQTQVPTEIPDLVVPVVTPTQVPTVHPPNPQVTAVPSLPQTHVGPQTSDPQVTPQPTLTPDVPVLVPTIPAVVATPVVTPPTQVPPQEVPTLVPSLPTTEVVHPLVTPTTETRTPGEGAVLVPPLTTTGTQITTTTGVTDPTATKTPTDTKTPTGMKTPTDTKTPTGTRTPTTDPKPTRTTTGTTDVTPTRTQSGGELAHTGSSNVGLLAGIAAALVAAGVGLSVLGREKRDDDGSDVAPG